MKTLYIVPIFVLAGCGASGPSANKLDQMRQEAAAKQKAVGSTLDSMTPEQRRAYLEAHPEALGALNGQPTTP